MDSLDKYLAEVRVLRPEGQDHIVDHLLTIVEAHREVIEDILSFTKHKPHCDVTRHLGAKCVCGLDTALVAYEEKIEGVLDNGK